MIRKQAEVEVFSTGQAAVVCGVATATVRKWCETGLLKSYRVPGKGGHRRVTRANLTAFLAINNLPVEWITRCDNQKEEP